MTDTTYEPEQIVLEKEEYAYGFIIEVLTRGLYPNKLHVMREYIQNSYDAVLAWRKMSGESDYGRIEVKVAPPSIFIYDNGVGMDRAKVSQYRYVGYSEKRAGEEVGFRGIGKLSGLSVADKLIVTSSPPNIPERYKLVFDANEMLTHILTLKLEGKNIPLNELIHTHTDITTDDEERDNHYTMVELYGVREDSNVLMKEEDLRTYLKMNAPVDFNPKFPYKDTIDTWLRDYVTDYNTAAISLNGEPIYKPYLTDLKPPQKVFVWDNHEQPQKIDDGDEVNSEPLAFCWYSEHTKKGQLKDTLNRGLTYRVKNFTVGTNQLPRITLWRSTPERTFYFFGEIHVCDPEIVPSSERGDFEQNSARERLYEKGGYISRTLNRIAGKSSDQRRAKEFIIQAEEMTNNVEADIEAGQIPKEIRLDKMFSVNQAIRNVEKRLPNAPHGFGGRGKRIVKKGNKLIKQLDEEHTSGIYDITQDIKLGSEAARVYKIIVDCLKEEFSNEPELYEQLLKRIHAALGARTERGK